MSDSADLQRPARAEPAGRPRGSRSLEEVHRSVKIPVGGALFKRFFAFAGPAYLVSVGYMDPGNWATNIEGGARFGYSLIWVLLMSNLMAVLLQTLSARLGIVTGRDLAQACRDDYPPLIRYVLFALCEIAIAATDLAEVLGTALGLNLLFGIPLEWAVLITGLDVFVLLTIQRLGMRKMEAFIIVLVATIGLCFIFEVFLSKPSVEGIAGGFVPGSLGDGKLYVAIGILGATVMPHNLYLHSALVQSRDVERTPRGIRAACRFNLFDSALALNAAFLVNAAMLIVAAATFFTRGIEVTRIEQAHELLDGLLGSRFAPIAFAVALICAGQSSTLTGTLAGQITMEGFLQFKMRPWLRRMITRSMAIVPAMIVIWIMGDTGTYELLILSQVVLSLQLPFAVVPLVKFTSSKRRMGEFRTALAWQVVAWAVAAVIVTLNAKLVYDEIAGWTAAAGGYGWVVLLTLIPLTLALIGVLGFITLRRDHPLDVGDEPEVSADQVADAAAGIHRDIKRIGVALDATATDAPTLAEAVRVARQYGATLVLMHVVEGVGGQWFGHFADDEERRQDERYVNELAVRLNRDLPADAGGPRVTGVLGYGQVVRELVRLTDAQNVDLLVTGAHGHRGLSDLIRGETVNQLRHGVRVPILVVRG